MTPIRFCHRLAMFQGLTPNDPAEYGFNVGQAGVDPHTDTDADAVAQYVARIPKSLRVFLAWNPKSSNEVFGGGPDEDWWSQLVVGLGETIDLIEEMDDDPRAENRVAGLRVNWEYRPSIWPHTPDWEAHLKLVDRALWTYVVYMQKAKWLKLLEDTKQRVHPVSFLESNTGTEWDKPTNDVFRNAYHRWIDYQCMQQAKVLNRLAEYAMTLWDLPVLLYPGGETSTVSPRLLPRIEYAFDQREFSHAPGSNILLEAGGWSGRSQSWVESVHSSIRGEFIATCQVDLTGDGELDAAADYLQRTHMAPNADGQLAAGYGLWSDWNPAANPELQPAMQRYMNDLREVMV